MSRQKRFQFILSLQLYILEYRVAALLQDGFNVVYVYVPKKTRQKCYQFILSIRHFYASKPFKSIRRQ